MPLLPFARRWARIEPLVRFHFASREREFIDSLTAEARQHLLARYTMQAALMDPSTDQQWVKLALNAILYQREEPAFFERQFTAIEQKLERWARLNFKPELVDDVKQEAFIRLYESYQRDPAAWDDKHESWWVASAKLAMRWANRDLQADVTHAEGSCRRKEHIERVQHIFSECDFPDFAEDEENDLLDSLSQFTDVNVHGRETQRANLRLDLDMLLRIARKHYNPAVFERCLLMLERFAEGYTSTEIRLELGWSRDRYTKTAQQVRQMSQFADGYKSISGRSNVLTKADQERIQRMRKEGCSQAEIARFVGCNPLTVWRVCHAAQA